MSATNTATDTRAGFWLMASVGIVAVLATAAVILWAPDEATTQETFASAPASRPTPSCRGAVG